jgi:hypothetical protein
MGPTDRLDKNAGTTGSVGRKYAGHPEWTAGV